MKNAMKKLTSLLLVAVLLVGAIPFGALAAEFQVNTFENEVVVNGSIVEEVVEQIDLGSVNDDANAGTPAPLGDDGDDAGAPAATNKNVTFAIKFSDKNEIVETKSVAVDSRVDAILANVFGIDVDAMYAKYNITKSSEKIYADTDRVDVTGELKKFTVTVNVAGTASSGTKENVPYGTVLNLDKSLLDAYHVSLADGYAIDYFSVDGSTYTVTGNTTITVYTKTGEASNNGGNNNQAQAWADVVINTAKKKGDSLAESDYLHLVTVDGKITEAQRQQVAAAIAGKNVIAWELENGQTSNSLINFTFTAPTNVWPVVQTGSANNGSSNNNSSSNTNKTTGTVIFKNYEGNTMYTATITDGKLSAVDVNNATNAANRTGYTFTGWKVNGAGSAAASDLLLSMTFANGDTLVPQYTASSNTLSSTKNQNDIFLNIFVNKDFQNCKTIKLNEHWVIADDKVTKDEILQYVVTDYYKAANGNIGLQADMLYYSVGSFMYNWLTDNGTLTIDNISAKRAQGTVTINIMVTNAAVAGSSAAADTSNPKTGDEIYTAMTVMGISAASLAAVMYFYNKKRQAI